MPDPAMQLMTWHRFTLVVIGCVASFIVMFVPPKSARKAVRVRNATAISGLSNVYLSLTSTWIGHLIFWTHSVLFLMF